MEFLPVSFIAGVLTVLAPCILPLLPVIIGGSLDSGKKDFKRPIIITISLALSIVLFTLLLKASTALITIPQSFWTYFSGGIILIFAVTLLFPKSYAKISNTFFGNKLEHGSQKLMYKMFKKGGVGSSIVLGAALGPVFASCSPTYFLILGTVLPANYAIGVLNLLVYALGLSLVMLIVAFAGKKLLGRLNGISNPQGWFKKTLGILFLIVGLAIISGYDKKFETYLIDEGFIGITAFEERLIENLEE